MIITDIVKRGQSETYKIYVDDEFYCFMQAETIVKNHIKKNMEIEEEIFKKIVLDSEVLTCKNLAINYVSKCLKTKKQVYDYLKQKSFSDFSIQKAIDTLESYGYINDKYYAETFVKLKEQTKGVNYIKNALRQKGINRDIIDDVTSFVNVDEEYLENISKKYLKGKTVDNSTKQKLYRHLISKGFNYDVVLKVVNKVLKEDNNDWN